MSSSRRLRPRVKLSRKRISSCWCGSKHQAIKITLFFSGEMRIHYFSMCSFVPSLVFSTARGTIWSCFDMFQATKVGCAFRWFMRWFWCLGTSQIYKSHVIYQSPPCRTERNHNKNSHRTGFLAFWKAANTPWALSQNDGHPTWTLVMRQYRLQTIPLPVLSPYTFLFTSRNVQMFGYRWRLSTNLLQHGEPIVSLQDPKHDCVLTHHRIPSKVVGFNFNFDATKLQVLGGFHSQPLPAPVSHRHTCLTRSSASQAASCAQLGNLGTKSAIGRN